MNEFKDDYLKETLMKSQNSISKVNFDNDLMSLIKATAGYKKDAKKKLILSFKVFVGAMSLGILATIIVLFGNYMLEYDGKTTALIALFVIITISILNIDNYRRLINMYG